MKAANSRLSHRPAERYANIGHIQGGMVTDADLTEAGQLHQARDEAQGRAFAGSGVPADGGMLDWSGGTPALRDGTVFAEGRQGHFRLDGAPDGLAAALAAQVDFPLAPDLPDGRVLLYADVWDRPVRALQDAYLADPGLHGAETSYRTRTMVQVKAVPLAEGGVAATMASHPAFARTGRATATAGAKQTELAVDDCDPCADQITITQSVPNALFRIEVVGIDRGDDGAAQAVALAWSLENGEAMVPLEPADLAAGIERAPAAYQYLSDATEAHQGWLPPGSAVRSAFSANLTEPPEPPDGDAFSHVRRWDGYARIGVGAAAPEAQLGTGSLSGEGGVLTLAHDFFTLTLDLTAGDVLVGDHWLVELRRYAPEGQRLRLNHAPEGTAVRPFGIEHRFCPLLVLNDGDATPLDLVRAGSFPALTDLPGTHVRYDPDPDCTLLGESRTVQQALDRLCAIDAANVAFDGTAVCETLRNTRNVAEALGALCAADDSTTLRLMLRTMMDWGVVCGVTVELVEPRGSRLRIGAGVVLDREGRLAEIPRTEIDLNELPEERFLGDIASPNRRGEVCVSISLTDAGFDIYVSDEATPFGPSDRTMKEAVAACEEGRGQLRESAVFEDLSEAEFAVLANVRLAASNRQTVKKRMAMTAEEARTADALLVRLTDEFAAEVGSETADALKATYAEIDRQANVGALSGQARDIRRMAAVTDKYTVLARSEEENRQNCSCLHRLVPCPARLREVPPLIPIACVDPVNLQPQEIILQRVCDVCCRKQANTPRSHRYYFEDRIQPLLRQAEDLCCHAPIVDPVRPIPVPDWDGYLDDIYRPIQPEVVPLPDPRPWPPIMEYEEGWFLNPDLTRPPAGAIPGYDPRVAGQVDIVDLPEAVAVEELTGRGFDVAGVVDAAEQADLLGALAQFGNSREEVAALATRQPQPGDKVVMIKDGVGAVDYVTVAAGRGATPFMGVGAQKELIQRLVTESAAASGGGAGEARVQALEEQVATLAGATARIDILEGRIAGLAGTTGDPGGGVAEGRVAALEERLSTLAASTARIDTIESRIAEIAERPPGAGEARLGALENQLETLTTQAGRIDGLEQRLAEVAGAPGDGLGTAGEARIRTLEEQLSTVSASTERIETLETRMAAIAEAPGDGLGDAGEQRLRALEDQLAAVSLSSQRLDALEGRIAEVSAGDARIRGLEDRLAATSATAERVEALEARMAERPAADEGRVAELEATVNRLSAALTDLQPVDAVVSREEATRLRASGITTVGVLRETPDEELGTALGSTRRVGAIRNSASRFRPQF